MSCWQWDELELHATEQVHIRTMLRPQEHAVATQSKSSAEPCLLSFTTACLLSFTTAGYVCCCARDGSCFPSAAIGVRTRWQCFPSGAICVLPCWQWDKLGLHATEQVQNNTQASGSRGSNAQQEQCSTPSLLSFTTAWEALSAIACTTTDTMLAVR